VTVEGRGRRRTRYRCGTSVRSTPRSCTCCG
jgi:hypothetical protein